MEILLGGHFDILGPLEHTIIQSPERIVKAGSEELRVTKKVIIRF
jgi:hypothetical protein